MSEVIQLTDFIGVYEIPQNSLNQDEYQAVLDKYEEKYLNRLLGSELKGLFLDDLINGVPQTQRFIDIYDSFYDSNDGCIIESDGMKDMLLGLVWGHIAELTDAVLTPEGTKTNNNANSENTGLQNSRMYNLYNQGVYSYRAIQWAICEDPTEYPEFDGVYIDIKTWL